MAKLLIPTDTSQATLGFLLADGSIPLTADWDAGAFDIKHEDNKGVVLGTGDDAKIAYDGTNIVTTGANIDISGSIGVGGAGIESTALINLGATDATRTRGIAGTLTYTGSISGTVFGLNFAALHSGTGASVNSAIGALIQASVSSTSGGKRNVEGLNIGLRTEAAHTQGIETAQGIVINSASYAGGQPDTSAVGLRIEDQGGASVPTVRGIEILAQTFQTTLINIDQQGTTGENRFAANTSIGAAVAPLATLDVTGNQLIDGDTDEVQFTLQAHTTQTNDLFVIEEAGGSDLFTIGGDPADAIASASGAIWDWLDVKAHTQIISGSTNITTATGFNLANLSQPTLSAASALTVTNAATLYIADAPTGGGAGPATITNPFALWVDAGATRLDGSLDVAGNSAFGSNVNVSSTRTVNVIESFTASNTVTIFAQATNAATSGDQTTRGVFGSAVFSGTSTSTGDLLAGLDFDAIYNSANILDDMNAIRVAVKSAVGGSGTLTNAVGVHISGTWIGSKPDNVYGVHILGTISNASVGTVKALRIANLVSAGTATVAISQEGTSGTGTASTREHNRFAADSKFGFASAPLAVVHVDQTSTTGAKPALILDQADVSEQCIQFSSSGSDIDINLFTVDVTGTPTLLWDESEDAFNLSKGLLVLGTFGTNIEAISSNTTLDTTHHIVTCDASGGSFTVTLPAASGITGRIYHIKKTDSSGNTVTVDGNSSETIDGATTKVISTQYDSMMISCDGSNWHII